MAEPPRGPDRLIILVGLPGAGKTTIGRRLADRLGLPFHDCDEEIERESGLAIAAIFERLGEPAFRRMEARTMARLLGGRPSVIAAGGGAFVHPATRALTLERGTVVWLNADIGTIADRLGDAEDRPLLGGAAVRGRLDALAAERSRHYGEAPIQVRAEGSVASVVERIVAALAERVR